MAQVRREDFRPEGSTAPFEKTITGAIGPYITLNRANFLVTRGVAGFAREEDVDLGLTVRLGLLAAPAVFGYERGGIAPQVNARVGGRVPGGFGYLEALANGLYDSEGLDSGSVQLAATAVLQPGREHVGILHVEGGWLKDPVPGGGVRSGPGYRTPGVSEPRLHRRPRLLRHRRVPGDRGRGLPGMSGSASRDSSTTAAPGMRDHAADRLGRRPRSSARGQPLHRHRRPALRPGPPVRERRGRAGWVITIGKGFVFSPLGRRPL